MGEAVTQFTVGPWNGVYWYTWENLQHLWRQGTFRNLYDKAALRKISLSIRL